jgi:hypothetical protein
MPYRQIFNLRTLGVLKLKILVINVKYRSLRNSPLGEFLSLRIRYLTLPLSAEFK